jgi:hypothetical protein
VDLKIDIGVVLVVGTRLDFGFAKHFDIPELYIVRVNIFELLQMDFSYF